MRATRTALWLLGSLATSAGFAQDAAEDVHDGDTAGPGMEEVLVTAQRREQSIQDVPISVTAFSSETIEAARITEAADYLSLTPNVSFSEDGSVGSRGVNISMRGVSDLKTGENSMVNSIGVYLDEFSVVSVANGTINPQLQDLERIEVLRGPQGTYFGRNSVGGALNLTTKKPTNENEFEVSAGTVNFEGAGEETYMSGIFNVPIAENFWVRGLAYTETNTGLVRNVNPTGVEDSGHDYFNGRLAMRWLPGDATTVDAMFTYTDEEQGADATVPSGVWDLDTIDTFGLPAMPDIPGPVDPGTGFWPDNRNRFSHDLDERNDNRTVVGVLTVAHDFSDEFSLKSITGIIDTDNDRVFDNDLIGGFDAVQRYNDNHGVSWSQELRLAWIKPGYDLTAGALYAQDDQTQSLRVVAGPDRAFNGTTFVLPPTAVMPVGLCLQCNEKSFEVDSIAAFADFTKHVTDRLDVSVGGRYTHDEVRTGLFNATAILGPPPLSNGFRTNAQNTETFDDFSPRVAATFAARDNVNLYGVVSKGYKAGGTSIGHDTNAAGFPAIIAPFDEEKVWNYEVGLKAGFLDDRLRLNASAFYLDWSDLQLESFRFLTSGDLSSNFEQTINVDDAEAMGIELELSAAPTENLLLAAGFGYLNTEITCDCTAELSGGLEVDLRGEPLPRAPEVTASLVSEYRWPGFNRDVYLRGEWIYRSEQFSDIEGLTWEQTQGQETTGGSIVPMRDNGFPFETPAYDVVNLRAGVDWNDRIDLSVFVENVLDEEYYTGTMENFGISGIRLKPHVRSFGANLNYRFK